MAELTEPTQLEPFIENDSRYLRLALHRVDPEDLGRRLRLARVAAGLTQVRLAEGIVSPAFLSRVESGQRRVGVHEVRALTERLQIPVGDLLADDRGDDAREAVQVKLAHSECSRASGHAVASLRLAIEAAEGARILGDADLVREASRVEAWASLSNGLVNRAEKLARRVCDSSPADLATVSALCCVASCRLVSSDLDGALGTAAKASQLAHDLEVPGVPDLLSLSVELARALVDAGRQTEAATVCRSAAARLDPGALPAQLFAASKREWSQGAHLQALRDADRAIALASLPNYSDQAQALVELLSRLESEPTQVETGPSSGQMVRGTGAILSHSSHS